MELSFDGTFGFCYPLALETTKLCDIGVIFCYEMLLEDSATIGGIIGLLSLLCVPLDSISALTLFGFKLRSLTLLPPV